MANYNFGLFKEKIKNNEEWLKKEYSSLRAGRATPSLLDNVFIDVYGSKTPISRVAGITSEDAKTLRIAPWDAGQIKSIEKAIIVASLGVSVIVDDKGVRVIFPDLTVERRESLIKILKQKLEDGRTSLRAEREKVWGDIQKKQKEGELSEDDRFKLKNEMQKLVDEAGRGLDKVYEKKEKEIQS